jgi:hypothetical protein
VKQQTERDRGKKERKRGEEDDERIAWTEKKTDISQRSPLK